MGKKIKKPKVTWEDVKNDPEWKDILKKPWEPFAKKDNGWRRKPKPKGHHKVW
ncbi:hypothetical protein UFOVP978_51 [uncultured Caudovirales phage]|uniref:Uncharacterized protein n=1 Tax=uncultured Caudovirales phage TaxID=2100421 RepID=A0A6J5QAL4_9CAUD|nr:hypothetical protein UFOVP978_51 [uncultured Caudovirales phage]